MTIRAVVLIAALLGCGAASAQGREGWGGGFERADTNGDGLVSREEFLAARAGQFGKRDRNGDGYFDKTDLGERAAARPRIEQALHAMMSQDTDQDGKVSKDEFVAGGAKIFDLADADHNGSLDKKELEAAKAALKERAAQRAAGAHMPKQLTANS